MLKAAIELRNLRSKLLLTRLSEITVLPNISFLIESTMVHRVWACSGKEVTLHLYPFYIFVQGRQFGSFFRCQLTWANYSLVNTGLFTHLRRVLSVNPISWATLLMGLPNCFTTDTLATARPTVYGFLIGRKYSSQFLRYWYILLSWRLLERVTN